MFKKRSCKHCRHRSTQLVADRVQQVVERFEAARKAEELLAEEQLENQPQKKSNKRKKKSRKKKCACVPTQDGSSSLDKTANPSAIVEEQATTCETCETSDTSIDDEDGETSSSDTREFGWIEVRPKQRSATRSKLLPHKSSDEPVGHLPKPRPVPVALAKPDPPELSLDVARALDPNSMCFTPDRSTNSLCFDDSEANSQTLQNLVRIHHGKLTLTDWLLVLAGMCACRTECTHRICVARGPRHFPLDRSTFSNMQPPSWTTL